MLLRVLLVFLNESISSGGPVVRVRRILVGDYVPANDLVKKIKGLRGGCGNR